MKEMKVVTTKSLGGDFDIVWIETEDGTKYRIDILPSTGDFKGVTKDDKGIMITRMNRSDEEMSVVQPRFNSIIID